MFIDWHSHLLPFIDDGSRDIKESLNLLEMLAEQGINKVVATPHFIADKISVEEFLIKREKSFNQLKAVVAEGMPQILLGAEVEYYPGICRLAGLKKLCIEKSGILLLEMPISPWTEYTVKELTEIAATKNITLVLAHIERYLKLQSPKILERLMQSGVLMQVNANFFTNIRTKRKALALLKKGNIQLLGSDCHNITSRPPTIGKAYEIIKNKFGEDFVCQMNEYGNSLLVEGW